MGCACLVTTKITVTSKTKKDESHHIKIKSLKNYFYSVTPNNWKKICDYLKFKELIEVGKLNR
jgi:hypothetical protein